MKDAQQNQVPDHKTLPSITTNFYDFKLQLLTLEKSKKQVFQARFIEPQAD